MSEDTFTTTVRIAASPDEVFPYLTDAALLVRWMGDWAELEPTPGGTFSVDIDGVPVRGRYVLVDPPHRLAFTWGAAGNAALPAGSTTVEITLRRDGEDTVLELVHRDLPPEELPKHETGWGHHLDRLSAAVGAERVWSEVTEGLLAIPDVASGRMLHAAGLNHRGKFFALLRRGDLVVKLPAARVDELERSGAGRRFEPGHGRVMREWAVVPAIRRDAWPALATEALAFAQRNAARRRP